MWLGRQGVYDGGAPKKWVHPSLPPQPAAIGSTVALAPTSGHVGQTNAVGLASLASLHASPAFAPGFAAKIDSLYTEYQTVEHAEEQISIKLQEAKSSCQKWTDVYAQERFQAFVREKKHVVMSLCSSFNDIAHSVYHGGHV